MRDCIYEDLKIDFSLFNMNIGNGFVHKQVAWSVKLFLRNVFNESFLVLLVFPKKRSKKPDFNIRN